LVVRLGLGALAGIGFMMSLFISGLAFVGEEKVRMAKISNLAAAVI